jgi:hypothetical protein
MHNLQPVAIFELGFHPLRARDNLAIELYGDAIGFHPQLLDQLRQRQWTLKRLLVAIDEQVHGNNVNQFQHQVFGPNRGARGLAQLASGALAQPPIASYPLLIQLLNVQNSTAASPIDAGSVSTQAISKLRSVAICKPDLFAHMVPATPDDKTWVVLTGNPM